MTVPPIVSLETKRSKEPRTRLHVDRQRPRETRRTHVVNDSLDTMKRVVVLFGPAMQRHGTQSKTCHVGKMHSKIRHTKRRRRSILRITITLPTNLLFWSSSKCWTYSKVTKRTSKSHLRLCKTYYQEVQRPLETMNEFRSHDSWKYDDVTSIRPMRS